MTNGTKTVGGAIASAIFAIALTATGSLDATSEHVAPFSGYLTVWAVCAGASFLAALALLAAPRHAFSDVRPNDDRARTEGARRWRRDPRISGEPPACRLKLRPTSGRSADKSAGSGVAAGPLLARAER